MILVAEEPQDTTTHTKFLPTVNHTFGIKRYTKHVEYHWFVEMTSQLTQEQILETPSRKHKIHSGLSRIYLGFFTVANGTWCTNIWAYHDLNEMGGTSMLGCTRFWRVLFIAKRNCGCDVWNLGFVFVVYRFVDKLFLSIYRQNLGRQNRQIWVKKSGLMYYICNARTYPTSLF